MYCSLYPDVLQLIPDGTAAYIITVIIKLTSAQLRFAMLQMGLWLSLAIKCLKMLENAKFKCNIGLTLFWPLKLGSILVIAIGYFLVEVNQVRMFILKTQISSYL